MIVERAQNINNGLTEHTQAQVNAGKLTTWTIEDLGSWEVIQSRLLGINAGRNNMGNRKNEL